MIDFLLHPQAEARAAEAASAPAAIDPKQFRAALSRFATGVTVVTTIDGDGAPRGFTANSFTSVSLDPPLVLVCVARGVNSYPALTRGRGFAINILSQEQRHLSQQFASKTADKFAGVDYTRGVTGSPIIEGALAWLECRHWRRVTAGDHDVLIGEVVDLGVNGGQPLAFFGSAYGAVAPLDPGEPARS